MELLLVQVLESGKVAVFSRCEVLPPVTAATLPSAEERLVAAKLSGSVIPETPEVTPAPEDEGIAIGQPAPTTGGSGRSHASGPSTTAQQVTYSSERVYLRSVDEDELDGS